MSEVKTISTVLRVFLVILKDSLPPGVGLEEKDYGFIWQNMSGGIITEIYRLKNKLKNY